MNNKGMSQAAMVTIIAGVLLAIGGAVLATQNKGSSGQSSSSIASSEAMMKKDSSSSSNSGTMMSKDTEKMVKSGIYSDYSQNLLANANSGRVVLFFKASWCPTCNALDKDITSKLDKIPVNTSILKIDYDTSTDLKKKYGITQQHTLVQVDASGNLVKKSVGLPTLEDIVSFAI